MRAILIDIFQPEACYKMENTYNIKNTYPLPPYSTVIGMIHKACDFDTYHEMRIGIQGHYSSTKQNVNTAYFFGGHKYEEGRHALKTKEDNIGITRGLMYTNTLNVINLKVYIVPEEKDFNIVYESFNELNKFLSLGRHEDIILINKVEIVELKEIENHDSVELNDYMYIPVELIGDSYFGTIYNLHKKFSYNKKKIRIWDDEIPSICTKIIPGSNMYLDVENDNQIVLV